MTRPFVIVGPTFGGATPTGGGAVALGSSLVQITVIPGPDATEERRTHGLRWAS